MSKKKKIQDYSQDFLKKLLDEMLLCRRFEELTGKKYGLREIVGFCHLYIGQEAVTSGSIGALDLSKDYVLTGYRDHAHALCCGSSPNTLMAELYGKVTGCSRGKGGSMHFFDAKNHMFGGNGIVGGQIPVATGVAFKIRYNKEDGVVLCYFGDGAIHQGAFHESLNLAKIWQLPIVYICENNQYGMGTDYRRVSSVHDFSIMANSYGLTGRRVDNGMDVLEVYEEVKEAVELARKSGEATLLDIRTYRYKGHSMSDPAKYRTKEELQEFKGKDPILTLKSELLEAKIITEDEFKEMDQKCKAVCDAAVNFAKESAEPGLETMYEDILV